MQKKVLWALLASSSIHAAEVQHLSFFGEFAYLMRQQLQNHAIVRNGNKVVLETKNVYNRFEFEPGYRVGAGFHPNQDYSLEGIYLQAGEWTAHRSVEGNHSLNFPFNHHLFAHDFNHADKAKATYRSRFWDAEGNVWVHMTPRNVDYFSVSWLLGLRYLSLKEKFDLAFYRNFNKSDYVIHTRNHIWALQTGLNLQVNPYRNFSWDFFLKIGPAVNWARQNTFLGDLNNSVTLRDFDSSSSRLALLVDAYGNVGYTLFDHLRLQVGYGVIYLANTANAPEQIDKKIGPSNGKKVNMKGQAVIHGLLAGATLSF